MEYGFVKDTYEDSTREEYTYVFKAVKCHDEDHTEEGRKRGIGTDVEMTDSGRNG